MYRNMEDGHVWYLVPRTLLSPGRTTAVTLILDLREEEKAPRQQKKVVLSILGTSLFHVFCNHSCRVFWPKR